MCLCYPGFNQSIDSTTCYDIDECSSSNGGCSQICNNSEGSYNCYCQQGFYLEIDGRTCLPSATTASTTATTSSTTSATSGMTSGATSGATTGATTGASSVTTTASTTATTSSTTSATSGMTSGATSGATTDATTGASSVATTTSTTTASTTNSTTSATSATSGMTSGATTGATTGASSVATTTSGATSDATTSSSPTTSVATTTSGATSDATTSGSPTTSVATTTSGATSDATTSGSPTTSGATTDLTMVPISLAYIQIRLLGIQNCSKLNAVSSSSTGIKRAVQETLNTYCNVQCTIQILKPALYCFDESSITLRGQVELTSIPYLEKWVNDGEGIPINILEYKLTVDQNCMVTITSLDEVGCGSGLGSPYAISGSLPIIPVAAGGVVAGVVLLLIIIAVIAMIAVLRRKRKIVIRNPLYDNVHGVTAAGPYDTITPGNPLAGIPDVSGAGYVQESSSIAEKEDTV
eukprot:Em0019g1074a